MKKLCFCIFSWDFDKAMASFIIATGAASSDYEVHMFFTFWGLNIIRKHKGKTLKGSFLSQKLFGLLNKGGSQRLKLSKFNFCGIGTSMIRGLMKKKNITSIEELIEMAKTAGVKLYVCDMSRDLMAISQEDFIEGVENFVGVATFLDLISDAQSVLFI